MTSTLSPPPQAFRPPGPPGLADLNALHLAPLWRRGMAWLIDFSLFHGAFFVAVELLGLGDRLGQAIHAAVLKRFDEAVLKLAPLLALALVFLLSWIGYRVTVTALWGSSIGRLIAGTRVVDAGNGISPPGWAKAAGRWGVPQALGLVPLPGFGAVAYLWALRDCHRRGMHDLVAGTVVIRARPRTASHSRAGARGEEGNGFRDPLPPSSPR